MIIRPLRIWLTPAEARRTMLPTHPQAPAACESGTPSCRRRPLGHEGLATLALRKLNRQPSGVPLSLTILPRGARRDRVSGPQSLR
jgi:hypothetical protein